jgi:hypothetical protein
LIPTGKRSGLQTRIAATECVTRKKSASGIWDARALLCENWAILLSRTAHGLSLNPNASEESRTKNPDRFNGFLSRDA